MASTEFDHPWKLDEAVAFVRHLQPFVFAAGFHAGLLGSVLTKGESSKDLDVLLYPHTTAKVDLEGLYRAMVEAGMKRVVPFANVCRVRAQVKSFDTKHVEVWEHEKRRIDVFFLR